MIKELKRESGKIFVKADYNREFIDKAKTIGGSWSKPYWVFPENNEDVLRELCLKCYGTYDGEEDSLTILADLEDCPYSYKGNSLMLGVIPLATRYSRDSSVVTAPNVCVVKGEFNASGGSARCPSVTWDDSVVLRIEKFPRMQYEALPHTKGITVLQEIKHSPEKQEKENTATADACVWKENEDGMYQPPHTDKQFDGTLAAEFSYCPYCGKPLVLAKGNIGITWEQIEEKYPEDRSKMPEEMEKAFVKDCFDCYEQEGFAKKFWTSHSDYAERIGQSFKVIGRCSTEDSDLSVLPMWNIEFPDSVVIGAYPEEIIPREMRHNGCSLDDIE